MSYYFGAIRSLPLHRQATHTILMHNNLLASTSNIISLFFPIGTRKLMCVSSQFSWLSSAEKTCVCVCVWLNGIRLAYASRKTWQPDPTASTNNNGSEKKIRLALTYRTTSMWVCTSWRTIDFPLVLYRWIYLDSIFLLSSVRPSSPLPF